MVTLVGILIYAVDTPSDDTEDCSPDNPDWPDCDPDYVG